MAPVIRWFVRLGLEQGLFTLDHARAVRSTVGFDAELVDFAQQLIDDAFVDDIGALERLAGQAMAKAAVGPPPEDPFEVPVRAKPRLAKMPSATTDPFPGRTPAPGPAPMSAVEAVSAVKPVTMSVARPKPSIGEILPAELDFEAVSAMGDDVLAKAMRGFLVLCGDEGVSDLHLSAGFRPFVRVRRGLSIVSEYRLTAADAMRLNTILLEPAQREEFADRKDFDYALALDASHRYRVNLMVHKNGAAGSYRIVSADVPKLDALGLRNVETIRKMLTYHNGLMLVTGPVGAGKTTTLAAMVAELNELREDHVITVEDPVEIVQVSKGCNITQRQIGAHTKSFGTALKGALREDPDIIVIGELRDLETIEMAISASETGHLVIGTMHTSDASTTLNRLLDVFPPAQQTQIRSSVAESLRGIVCQRLLPGATTGLVLATEILVSNPAVAALIREGKMQGLRNVMETGVRDGMCTMESSVMELYRKGSISADVARQNITTKQMLAQI